MTRQRRGWYLFELAGESLMMNGVIYFLPWLMEDLGFGDFWFNFIFPATSLLLLATAPILGRYFDISKRRSLYLWSTCGIVFFATLGIYCTNLAEIDRHMKGTVALMLFFIVIFTYQLGLVFYNSLLKNISLSGEFLKNSGSGTAAAWFGDIVGIFVTYWFVKGLVPFFPAQGAAQAFLPSALLYGGLTALSLYLMRSLFITENRTDHESSRSVIRDTWTDIRNAKQNRNVWLFLCSMFFFCDAVLTIQINSSEYLKTVMHFNADATVGLYLLLLAMAVGGAKIPAMISTRFSNKQILTLILAAMTFALISVSVTTSSLIFAILFGAIGSLCGALWTTMRAFFLEIIPNDHAGQYFGLYAMLQRFSTLIGPLLWVGIARLMATNSAISPHRYSMFSMGILIAVSLIFLHQIKPQSSNRGTDDGRDYSYGTNGEKKA